MAQQKVERQAQGLRGNMGWLEIVFFVVAAAAPLTVVFGSLPAAVAFGGVGISGAVLVAGFVLLLFAVGFTAMSGYVRNTGAFYAYAAKGLGKPTGIGVSLVAVVSYAVLSLSFYGLIGFFGNIAGNEAIGLDLPWWLYSGIAILAVSIITTRKVDAGARVLGVLLTLEVLIVLILLVAIVVTGAPEGYSAEPFSPDAWLLAPGAGFLFVLAFGAFLGFEATAVYSEEARNPKRDIPIATYVAVAFLAIFYALSFWVIISGFGIEGALAIGADPESAQFLTAISATTYLGELGADAMLILVVTSFFACLLAFHNATARYLFAMGREGLLPRSLEKVNTHGSPTRAGFLLVGLAVVVIVLTAVTGTDPYFGMGIWAYSIGVAGLVFVQALAAFSVVGFFAKNHRGHTTFRVIIAPLLGAIGLTIGWYLIITNFSAISGSTDSEVNFWLIAPTPVLFLGGLMYGQWMKRKSPARFEALLGDGL